MSKNNQHRLRHIHSKNKCVKAYAVVTSPRCVVKILDYYYKKIPLEPKAFYLRPLAAVPKDPTKPWFANVPVGVNTLKNIVSKIAKQAGSTNKYTNHSLRATTTSRMFVKNVPEKIIAEKSSHRSLVGLRPYERTTLDQEHAVTKSLASVNATLMYYIVHVHCVLHIMYYIVHCVLHIMYYIVHCVLHIMYYIVHCVLHNYNVLHSTLCITYNVLHSTLCITYNVLHSTLCITYNVLHSALCITYNVLHSTLCIT